MLIIGSSLYSVTMEFERSGNSFAADLEHQMHPKKVDRKVHGVP